MRRLPASVKNSYSKTPKKMNAEVLLYTDWETYGGKTQKGKEKIRTSERELSADLSRFSGMILKLTDIGAE